MKVSNKYILVVISTLLVVTLSVCSKSNNQSETGYECYACYSKTQPQNASLYIKLTNSGNEKIPITIYDGNYEIPGDKNIRIVDTAISDTITFKLPVNKFYSVRAEYKSGSKIIYAVDGDELKAYKEDCEIECWNISGYEIDVTLKF